MVVQKTLESHTPILLCIVLPGECSSFLVPTDFPRRMPFRGLLVWLTIYIHTEVACLMSKTKMLLCINAAIFPGWIKNNRYPRIYVRHLHRQSLIQSPQRRKFRLRKSDFIFRWHSATMSRAWIWRAWIQSLDSKPCVLCSNQGLSFGFLPYFAM